MNIAKRALALILLLVAVYPQVNAQSRGEKAADKADRAKDRDKPPPPPPPPPIAPTPQPPTTRGVRVFGDWPSTGRCDFTLYPHAGYQGLPNAACNDQISAVDVPFGMSIEICQHDGQGKSGLGKCRRFLPGVSGLDEELNDKGTSFKVENKMICYLNSADYSPGVKIEITSSNASGSMETDGSIGYDNGWIIQRYSVTLPSHCSKAKVVETTKAGDADWGYHISNNRLGLFLKIRARKVFGGNNWIGVEIICP
jgi:hypothetical protein